MGLLLHHRRAHRPRAYDCGQRLYGVRLYFVSELRRTLRNHEKPHAAVSDGKDASSRELPAWRERDRRIRLRSGLLSRGRRTPAVLSHGELPRKRCDRGHSYPDGRAGQQHRHRHAVWQTRPFLLQPEDQLPARFRLGQAWRRKIRADSRSVFCRLGLGPRRVDLPQHVVLVERVGGTGRCAVRLEPRLWLRRYVRRDGERAVL